jgi:hypothetical protein
MICAADARKAFQFPEINASIRYIPVMVSGGAIRDILPIGAGAICNTAKKKRIRRVANQNSGMDTPRPERIFAKRSVSERRRSAETKPSGMAQKIASNIANVANSIVAGQREARSNVTGLPVRQLDPKSPTNSCFM